MMQCEKLKIKNTFSLKRKYTVLFLFIVFNFSFCDNKNKAITPVEKGLASITAKTLKKHVEIIAGDKMEGRETGSAGASKAADYIAARLKGMGITPYEGKSYFQYLNTYAKQNNLPVMRNVVGKIDGKNKDEFIVIGAHYDHIGIGDKIRMGDYVAGGDSINNGADDNASGVSAVLQVAKAFSDIKEVPLKTIIFAFWDSEEPGSNGSEYFINRFNNINRIKAYVNLDMVGRDKKGTESRVAFIYSDTTKNYKRIFEAECEVYKLNMELVTDTETLDRDFFGDIYTLYPKYFDRSKSLFVYSSDHNVFEHKNIPIFLYTTGIHSDYHRVTDHADKISLDKLTKVTKLSFLTVYYLANTEV